MTLSLIPACASPIKSSPLFSRSSFEFLQQVNMFTMRSRNGLSIVKHIPLTKSSNKTNTQLLLLGLEKRTLFPYSCNYYSPWSRSIPSNISSHYRWKFQGSLQNVTSTVLPRSTKLQETRAKVSKKMEELKENVMTIPNALCVMRMAITPFLGYLVLQEYYSTSFGIFVLAGCTDVIDGFIARTFPSQQSMIGSFLDPAADKLLIATLFLALTAKDLIPVPLTLLIILRDVCLMTAGFYIRYVSLPPPKTISRYFDVSFATARLSPTGISKINTGVQLSLVAFSLASPVFGFVDHIFLHYLWYTTAATTIISAGSYIFTKNTYKMIATKRS